MSWENTLKATPKRKRERQANWKGQMELDAKAGLHNIKDEREDETWNVYIKDFHAPHQSSWITMYEASIHKRQVDKDIETDSQDETYKRFYERVSGVGFDITGNKNQGVIRMLVEGFMESLQNNQNFYYVVSKNRPKSDYRFHVDTTSGKYWREKFGDTSYEQLQNM